MAVRPYTGISDIKNKIAKQNQATENMVNLLGYMFGMQKVGTIGNSLVSPHASGRAFDIRCWDFSKNTWASRGFEERNWNLINYLYMNRDYLGVEEIHDYIGLYVLGTMVQYDGSGRGSADYYGAGYRCSRDNITEPYAPAGWKRWNLESHKSHGGDSVGLKHIHVEMSPSSLKNTVQLNSKLVSSLKLYFARYWHYVTLQGSGANAYALATRLYVPVVGPTRKETEILRRM